MAQKQGLKVKKCRKQGKSVKKEGIIHGNMSNTVKEGHMTIMVY
jgi:hypothetical protein